jgi:hypothetical protein
MALRDLVSDAGPQPDASGRRNTLRWPDRAPRSHNAAQHVALLARLGYHDGASKLLGALPESMAGFPDMLAMQEAMGAVHRRIPGRSRARPAQRRRIRPPADHPSPQRPHPALTSTHLGKRPFGEVHRTSSVAFDAGRSRSPDVSVDATHSDVRRLIRATGCGTVLGWMKH